MKIIKQGSYTVRRLDLIPNFLKNPTALDYFLEVLTPAMQKLQRVDNIYYPFEFDDDGVKTNIKGSTRILKYQAYFNPKVPIRFIPTH